MSRRMTIAEAIALGARPTQPDADVGVLAKPKRVSRHEELLMQHVRLAGLPEPKREYRFHPTRRWRFDAAWPDVRVAAEVEGVTYAGQALGRHQRPEGMARDAEKYNAAALAGWRVLRFTQAMIESGQALATLTEALDTCKHER